MQHHGRNMVEIVQISLIFIASAYSWVQYIGVRISVRHLFHPSVNFVTINFSVPMISSIMEHCIEIVLEMLYKHAPEPCTSDLHFTLHWLCQNFTLGHGVNY